MFFFVCFPDWCPHQCYQISNISVSQSACVVGIKIIIWAYGVGVPAELL
jgi:hypothetical protein